MYIGYNIKKINEVMEGIRDAYAEATKKVDEMYNHWFQPSLRQHWVGPDEQDFEKKFVERLNNLLRETDNLAKNAIDNIFLLGEAWADFQDKNTIGGESTGQGAVLKSQLSKPPLIMASVILFTAIEFNGSENLGLATSGSAGQLAAQLQAFVDQTKSSIKQLFDAVEVGNAFFGEQQTTKVKGYVEKVGEVLGIVTTSVKDFDEAMATLTGTSYSSADASASESYSSAESSLESGLGELGSSRWS